jgi:hypothetical protein
MSIQPQPERRIQNVRFSIGSNGRYYFYATDTFRHRTIFLAFREAITYATPVSDGLEFSPGYILPYGEIAYRLTSLLIWTNATWTRRHYRRLPVREPRSNQIIGWTINFREYPEGILQTRDVRNPLGRPLDLNKLILNTQHVIAKALTGDSLAGIFVQNTTQLRGPERNIHSPSTNPESDVHLEIVSITWFIDTFLHRYKKFVDQPTGGPIPQG